MSWTHLLQITGQNTVFFALVSLIMDIVSLKTFTKGQISNRIESKCLKINHKMSFDINAIEANYFDFRCEYFQLFELSYSNYCYQNVWTFEEWNFSITELLDYWTYWKLNLLKTELIENWTSWRLNFSVTELLGNWTSWHLNLLKTELIENWTSWQLNFLTTELLGN